MAINAARAASSTGSGRRSNISARPISAFIAAASSRFSTSTWLRESSAPFSSKDGFSVVAPTRMMVPSSTTGQKGILLGLVEAVDFVDEQQRTAPLLAPDARLFEHLLEIRHAGEDRRDLLEGETRLARQQPRDGGLAGARRPPQDDRRDAARRQHAREDAVFAGQ